jgi:hypothetical protein
VILPPPVGDGAEPVVPTRLRRGIWQKDAATGSEQACFNFER